MATRSWIPYGVALLLFAIWSNSFIAMGYLLGAETAGRRLDWIALTVARFLPVVPICFVWAFGLRGAESLALLRDRWRRLLACGFLTVPGYNLALYYAQQHGVPAPIASLTTALVPLFLMLLAAGILGEPLTPRKALGFAIAFSGMLCVASAKQTSGGPAYPLLILVAAAAPLCWSVFSVLSKPVMQRSSPLVWTLLSTGIGGLLVLPLLPGRVWRQWVALDAAGWAALFYLSFPCTLLGFALWAWLLRQLPASSVGFAVFLNPPLTVLSKRALSLLFPTTFLFTLGPLEWLGGALALIGIAVALSRRRRGRRSGLP